MPTTVKTMAYRITDFKTAVEVMHEKAYNTEKGRTPGRPAAEPWLGENGEPTNGNNANVKCTILKGGSEAEPFFAMVPAKQAVRRGESGALKVKISETGTEKGKYITEASLMDRYYEVIPGVLTVSGTAGAAAHTVKMGEALVVISPVEHPDKFTQVTLDVGGLAGPDAEAVDIEVAVKRLGLEWQPLEGRPATVGGHEIRPIFASWEEGGTADVPLDRLSGGDALMAAAMKAVGAVPQGSAVPARDLARFMAAAAGGNAEHVTAITIGLTHGIEEHGDDEPLGDGIINAWAAVVSGMEGEVMRAIAAHDFGGGRTAASGQVPPNEVEAHVRNHPPRYRRARRGGRT
jgi:hypothetical protein